MRWREGGQIRHSIAMSNSTPHPNETLIHGFYEAFLRKDHATMGAAYADDAKFSDPVFPELDAGQVRTMWRMLLERGTDLELSYSGISANEREGVAHWEAAYTFHATGRKVRNVIDAKFAFREGRIVRHEDSFDFWRWSRMALGFKGALLGWTPLVRNKVQATAAKQLATSK